MHQIAALATWTLLTLNPKFVQNPTFPLQTPCSGGKLKVTVNTAYQSCRHTRQLQSRQFDTVLRSTNVRHDINTHFCFCIALSLCRLTPKKNHEPSCTVQGMGLCIALPVQLFKITISDFFYWKKRSLKAVLRIVQSWVYIKTVPLLLFVHPLKVCEAVPLRLFFILQVGETLPLLFCFIL